MKHRNLLNIGLILLIAVGLGFFDLPADTQKSALPFTPDAITQNKVHLGLDLQGGSQLDYKIDLRKVPEKDKKGIVDGILNVINKRVNSLGVAEPNIYTSDVGDEKHLIVELAGIKDLEEAKAIVGKTIQLEFKERKENPEVEAEVEQKTKEQAQALLDKVKAGQDIQLLGKEEEKANPGKVFFNEVTEFKYKEDVNENIANALFALEPGQTNKDLIEESGSIAIDETGNYVTGAKSFQIVQLTEKKDTEREINTPREVSVSHLLVAYKGAQKADEGISRTKEEAQARAQEALNKLQTAENPAKWEDIVKEYSDEPGAGERAGKLEDPSSKDKGNYVKEFEDGALALTEANQLSPLVESPFGYHIIKADKISEEKNEKVTEPQVKYTIVSYSATPDPWQETGLNGKHFVRADVEFNQNSFQPYVSIAFNDDGAKLFEEITRRNTGKPLAIFVGGQLISAPNVNEAIAGGHAQINGSFTMDEANELARDLNTGAIPAPITLAGQYTIGATLGNDALNKSLFAGFIGVIILSIFMIFYYRLPGVLATLALTIYSAILIALIKVEMPLVFALGISLAVFVVIILKILKNKESGAEKAISTVLACFVLFFLTYVLATPIVLTLAGIAGVILSIGMAVDANILIFERIKEELRDGRSLGSAIDVGFERAWSSIRDSNFSSLITCGILFYFGSSIIQGFAFNLAAGILVSMFTAITITKKFIEYSATTKLANKLWLFETPERKERKLWPIIKWRKTTYYISAAVIFLSLAGIPIFGLKLGLDFTGGTLLELKFQKEVTVEQIKTAFADSQDAVNGKLSEPVVTEIPEVKATPETATPEPTEPTEPTENAVTDSNPTTEPQATTTTQSPNNSPEPGTSPSEPPILANADEEIDLGKVQVLPSEDRFIIKTPHISARAHDILITELKSKLGEFEESRFSTVGPIAGESMQSKAIFAVLLASLIIVLYIAFAFRSVPKYIGKWRFGLSAIIALLHDLTVMLGVYIFLGLTLGVEVDTLFITALLTVLGFSVHDTIVVFDRIREKLRQQKHDDTFADVANRALNDTMARSINTSLSTLIVLLLLALMGPVTIKFFIISLIVGIIAGTYSSICVATPILVDWHNWARNKKNK